MDKLTRSASWSLSRKSLMVVTDGLDDPELNPRLIAEARRLLTPAQLQEARSTFRELDADDSGALDGDELFEALRTQVTLPGGVAITRERVDELVSEFDESGDGEIQLDEVRPCGLISGAEGLRRPVP